MKIAIIAPTFIPAKRANTLQVMKMTDAIVNLGHQVRLAVPEDSGRMRVDSSRWEDTTNCDTAADWEAQSSMDSSSIEFDPQFITTR